ncbi:SRPBCC family protein [Streptomyces sp. NPDC001941]|uniref:SRPBCC family protein n=1 Tax=Streptomyces sp. NPDC001941 TaxID=3154659 RepID=UPI0033164E15
MIRVVREFRVDHDLTHVVAYLADFAHTVHWDPGTRECRRIGEGPVEVGARWLNTSTFRGRTTRLTYVLERQEPGRLTFTGRNKTATTTDDLHFGAEGGGTRITYQATISFHGLARLAEPVLKREFERLGDEITQTLPAALLKALPPSAGLP